MVQTIISQSGNTRGWLVDDYFIPIGLLKFFTSQGTLRGMKVVGTIDKSGVKIRGKRYPNILKVINSKNCREVLRSFIVNGIILHDVLFFPCSLSDIDTEGISSFWKVAFDLPLRSYSVITVTDSNFKMLGYLFLRQDLFKSKSIYINMIEVIDKQKGIGTNIVSRLKELGIGISGLSTSDAIPFWEKQGAKIVDKHNHFTI